MKFHGITMAGKFILEKVSTLPTVTAQDEGRIVYNTSDKNFYIASDTSWSTASTGISGSGGTTGSYGDPVTNVTDGSTLNPNNIYFIDTYNSALSVNLLASPNLADTLTIVDVAGSFDTHNLTVNGNGNNIETNTTLVLKKKNSITTLVWSGSSWKVDRGGNDSTVNELLINNLTLDAIDSPTDITADGGGITLKGSSDKTIKWDKVSNTWMFNPPISSTNLDSSTLNGHPLSYFINVDNYKWIVVTTNQTLTTLRKYIVDTSSNIITLTLPVSPNNGDCIQIADGGDFSVHNLVINGNGHTIEGLNEDMTVSTHNASFEMIFYNNNWQLA